MSQSSQMPAQQRISDLKVSGHLMTLQTGLFCIFHTPGQPPPSAAGLPGVRISRAPLSQSQKMEIVTFEPDGWIGAQTGAALVRVHQGPVQVMVTIYQELDTPHEAPRLQVVQLSAQAEPQLDAKGVPEAMLQHQVAPAVATGPEETSVATIPEIGAHIQRQGDVAVRLGEWMGQPGSNAWIEGFGISPTSLVGPEDIEYQAVLGKGWLSPWVEGGKYCGSRGMALPILGLCVRLKGKAAKQYICRVQATFTDGTEVGPLETDEPVEAPTLAPLEAFLLKIVPRRGVQNKKKRSPSMLSDPLVAEAELAALLDEEETAFDELGDDFALSLEDETDWAPQDPTTPVMRRGRGKVAPSKAKAGSPSPKPVKRGRKAATVKQALPFKETRRVYAEEGGQPERRGRGRPARRSVEQADTRPTPTGRTVAAKRATVRRRKAATRRG